MGWGRCAAASGKVVELPTLFLSLSLAGRGAVGGREGREGESRREGGCGLRGGGSGDEAHEKLHSEVIYSTALSLSLSLFFSFFIYPYNKYLILSVLEIFSSQKK
jgi:hypothetical protein